MTQNRTTKNIKKRADLTSRQTQARAAIKYEGSSWIMHVHRRLPDIQRLACKSSSWLARSQGGSYHIKRSKT